MSIWASEDSSMSKELLSSSTRNPYINAERGGERLFYVRLLQVILPKLLGAIAGITDP